VVFLSYTTSTAMTTTQAYGVHINGFVETDAGLELWVARRSKDKPTWPGKLDHIVAGGQVCSCGLLLITKAGTPRMACSAAAPSALRHHRNMLAGWLAGWLAWVLQCMRLTAIQQCQMR